MPSLPPKIDQFIHDLDAQLHEPGMVTNVLGTIETRTGIKRLYIVAVIVIFQSLYLMVGGSWAQFICNIIGLLYPAYVSIGAIESVTKEDDTQWLTYWIVFASLNVVEFFNQAILYYIPFYYLIKCILLLYLYLPMTRGAQTVYTAIIRPIYQGIEGKKE